MSHRRTKLGALLGAGALLMLAASTALAVAPTYTIVVTKAANPESVPASGGTVEYTVWVENTGTGDFGTVVVADDMCTLDTPSGDTDTDGKLDPGETWTYACTVDNVMPDTTNTVTVNACNASGGECTSETQNSATGGDSVTVIEAEATADPGATDPGATDPGATDPNATQADTATEFGAATGSNGNAVVILLALGILLASLVLVKPARANRNR